MLKVVLSLRQKSAAGPKAPLAVPVLAISGTSRSIYGCAAHGGAVVAMMRICLIVRLFAVCLVGFPPVELE
jgi:hypothetical protein